LEHLYSRHTAPGVDCVVSAVDFMKKKALTFQFLLVEAGQCFMFFQHEFPASGSSGLMDATGENIEFTLTADQGIDLGKCRVEFP
jgi:hypothetical protein